MARMRLFAGLTLGMVVALVLASTAQAAYMASRTLYGTDSGSISTVQCAADIWSNASLDAAATSEHSGSGCASVSVKIYYYNPAGYAGWSGTVTHPYYAQKALGGSDELQRSYHTAVR